MKSTNLWINTMSKEVIFALLLGCMLIANTIMFFDRPKCEPTEVIVEVPVEVSDHIMELTVEDMYNDLLARYPHISKESRDNIILSIAKAADKYEVNPLVLYSIIAVESSFRWWILHPQVTVQDYEGNSVKTRAIGLGGVVYEIWGHRLKEAGIITTKADLFQIEHNIDAIGFIYSTLKAKPLHPKANNSIESGLIRYFGGGYRSYFDKIDTEIVNMFRNKLYGEYK